VILAAAVGAALACKKEVQQASPPAPEMAIAGVKEDVETVKGKHTMSTAPEPRRDPA